MDATPHHPSFDERPADARGILLALDPTRPVVLGTFRLDHDDGGANGRFLPRIRLVVADAAGARCLRLDTAPGRPKIARPRKAPAGWAMTSYFDVGLDRILREPRGPSFVYAFFGAHVSNVVRVDPAYPGVTS